MTFTLADLKLTSAKGYTVNEVFDGDYVGDKLSSDKITVNVNPTGVVFLKATRILN